MFQQVFLQPKQSIYNWNIRNLRVSLCSKSIIKKGTEVRKVKQWWEE